MSTGIGDALKEAREAQGRTLEDVSRAVRARIEQLRALEEEHFDVFPGEVYAKGFLRSYAIELGLDPQPLLETYRNEVSSPNEIPASTLVTGSVPQGPRRSTPPAWAAWLLIGVAVIAGLAFLGMISQNFLPESASSEEVASPPPAPAPAPTEEQAPEQAPEPEPVEPEPVYEGLEMLVTFESSSWIRVTLDGVIVEQGTVMTGETRPYQADERIDLRIGNAGGVRIEINGEDLGLMGSSGEVVEVGWTLDDFDDGE